MIGGVHKVVIDVESQDRALDFWTSKLGFEVAMDAEYGDERWLEVRSPDGGVILILGRSPTGPGDRAAVPSMLPTSNIHFYSEDIRKSYDTLTARGVSFTLPPVEQPFGWWSLFVDTEGNRFALTERRT